MTRIDRLMPGESVELRVDIMQYVPNPEWRWYKPWKRGTYRELTSAEIQALKKYLAKGQDK